MSTDSKMAIVIHDVLIIGAGPAGVAIAAGLREPTPSSIFTDAEHVRYQWIRKHSERMILHPRAHRSQSLKGSSTLSTSSERQVGWKPLCFSRSAKLAAQCSSIPLPMTATDCWPTHTRRAGTATASRSRTACRNQ